MTKKSNKKFLEEFLVKYFAQVESVVADAVAKILKIETAKLLKLIKESAVPGPPGAMPIAGKDFDLPEVDHKKVAAELIHLLPDPEAKETAEELATKLNTLKEKIERKVIKGLDEEFEALRGLIFNIGNLSGGGDTIASRNLTSQTDGSTKSFTLTRVREVIGAFGTSFPINHDPDNDWTFTKSSGVFALASGIKAPRTGQTLWLLVKES